MSLLQSIWTLERAIAQSRVGWTFPSVRGGCSHLAHSRRCRLATGSTTSRTGRVGIAVLASHSSLLIESAPLMVHQTIEQGPGHGAVRVEGDLPSPEANVCDRHKRSGFLTACDHAEQPPGLACSQASGPTPRERNTTPKPLDSAYRPRTRAQAA
jgi:hypothetical protein